MTSVFDSCYCIVLISTSRGCSHGMTSSQLPVDNSSSSRRRPTGADQQATPAVWTCHEGIKSASTGTCRAHTTLEAILGELRTVTGKMRVDEQQYELTGEWKYAAMVMDRVCLLTFTAFTIVLTLAILLSAPHLIVF